MSKFFRVIPAAMVIGTLAIPAHAAMLEQVNLDGSAGHADIQSAVSAVDDGGVVEIIEAGTYEGSVILPGGKAFTIRATVPGVISQNVGTGGLYSVPNAVTVLTPPLDLLFIDGKVDVTFEDFTIRRADGTGPAFDIDQRLQGGVDTTNPSGADDFTVKITFDNMVVEHTQAVSGGEALKIDDGPAGTAGNGATLTVNAIDSTFTTVSASGTSKSAFRVQSDPSDVIDNLTVNLTNCYIEGVNEGVVRNDGRFNQNWTLNNTTIVSPNDRGFEMDDPHSGSTFVFNNVTINAQEECVLANDPGEDIHWTFNRCTFNASLYTPEAGGDITVNIRYQNVPTDPVFFDPVPSSTVDMYNCLILGQEGVGSNFRGFNQELIVASLFNNTFIGGGTGCTSAMGNSNGTLGSGTLTIADSNLMINYLDPNLMSGSYSGSGYNIIVGPADDSSRGPNSLYVAEVAGKAACIAAAGINATTYIPQAGSVALGASNPDVAVLTAIGSVDHLGVTRPGPIGSIHDVGAFENATLPAVVTTIPGDVNNDGFVDVADVTELGNYINAIVGLPAGDADVDNIGGVGDAADLNYLVNFLVNGSPAPPAP